MAAPPLAPPLCCGRCSCWPRLCLCHSSSLVPLPNTHTHCLSPASLMFSLPSRNPSWRPFHFPRSSASLSVVIASVISTLQICVGLALSRANFPPPHLGCRPALQLDGIVAPGIKCTSSVGIPHSPTTTAGDLGPQTDIERRTNARVQTRWDLPPLLARLPLPILPYRPRISFSSLLLLLLLHTQIRC